MDTSIDEVFDVGSWVGRKEALSLMARRCSAAEADILFEIREKKLFTAVASSWEDFCTKRLHASRSYVDRIIRQYRELGPNFAKLSCFTRIKPAEYRLIAGSVSEDGLSYGGEVIPLEPANAPQLAEAVEALCREAAPPTVPANPVEQAFSKADRALRVVFSEYYRLREMGLEESDRAKLLADLKATLAIFEDIHRCVAA